MDTLPMRLMVNPDATPIAHHSPIPVPLHWQDEVKAGLDRDVELGVLKPVPVGEPVTWCHRMVICAKINGKPRRTVDFQALNIHATRETHHTPSPFHQARSVPCKTKKTVLDCWNGYHSVPLHPDDRHLTTFITPWGRYRYKTAPRATLLLAMASSLQTLRYRFRMMHIPGARHKAADAMSRYPTGPRDLPAYPIPDDIANISQMPEPHVQYFPLHAHPLLSHIRQSANTLPPSATPLEQEIPSTTMASLRTMAITWDRVKEATSSDTNMLQLLRLIDTGFPPTRETTPTELQPYYQARDHLSTFDGVVLYKHRIFIPTSLRPHVLSVLHSAHQGVTSMVSRAESTVFWPGITKDIRTTRESCPQCNRMAPSQPNAPPTIMQQPCYPFQLLCADYFHYQGVNYLVLVDWYSNWPIVERAHDGANGLVNTLRRTFGTYGIPEELATDGGPEFTSALTRQFLADWGIHH